MCCVFVLLCLAAAVWRGLSLSPQVVVIENASSILEISLGSGYPAGPISHPRHLATAHKRQSTGDIFREQTTSRGPAGLKSAMCTARRCTAVHDKSRKKGPFGDDQNEKRPAPFCASREPGTPGSMIPSRYQHAPLAGPVNGYWAEGHPEHVLLFAVPAAPFLGGGASVSIKQP
jgi:hypothetical protein